MRRLFHSLVLLSWAAVGFAADGQKVFEYSFGRPLDVAPAVDLDGTIYVGGAGAIAALSPAGAELWRAELEPGSQAKLAGISIGPDRIYVTVANMLLAFSKSGAPLWKNTYSSTLSPVALIPDGDLYVGEFNGALHAILPNGHERWSRTYQAIFPAPCLGATIGPDDTIFIQPFGLFAVARDSSVKWADSNTFGFSPPSIASNGTIFVPTGPSATCTIRAVSSAGEKLWDSPMLAGSSATSPLISPEGDVVVQTTGGPNDGVVVLGTDGRIKWKFLNGADAASAIAEDGTMYVPTADQLVAFSPKFSRVWEYGLQAPIAQGLAIGMDHSVLAAQTNGVLIAIAGSSPLASKGWPVFGGNARHTFFQPGLIDLSMDPPSETGTNSVRFTARARPEGRNTTVYFEYSNGAEQYRTAAYEISRTNEMIQVSELVTNLAEGTFYAAHLFASNSVTTGTSTETFFQTKGAPAGQAPSVLALEAAASTGGILTFSEAGRIVIDHPVEVKQNVTFDANGHDVTISGSGLHSLFTITTNVQVTFKGVTLADALAQAFFVSNSVNAGRGGAIKNFGGALTLIDCTLSNNLARGAVEPRTSSPFPPLDGPSGEIARAANVAGAAIWQEGGTLTLQNCRFYSNSAAGGFGFLDAGSGEARGGAIYLKTGSAHMTNSVFVGNGASSGSSNRYPLDSGPALGGAVYFEDSQVQIYNSVFEGNGTAASANFNGLPTADGGAIYISGGNLFLAGSTLSSNRTDGGYGGLRGAGRGGTARGAGLYNSGTAVVNQTTFLDNVAQGGAGYEQDIAGGPAAGGGIYNSGELSVVNSTFTGNSAFSTIIYFLGSYTFGSQASAIDSATDAALTNVTIAFNKLASAAIRGSTQIILKNSLLVSNETANASTNVIDAGNNFSSDETPAFTHPTSRTNIDAKLGPLGDYGGGTLVYPLLAGSPAIDAADTAAAPTVDQRGRARPFGNAADIGAFESSPPYRVWGKVRGYLDPSATFTQGETVVPLTSHAFEAGFFPAGPTELLFSATNSVFRPNPLTYTVVADGPLPDVDSFELHALTWDGAPWAPAFTLAGYPGETWRIDTSGDLRNWTNGILQTIPASGLTTLSLPAETKLFLRAQPQ